jgi:molybdopterin synthase catalytic subunit
MKKSFISGAISPDFIAQSIAKHQTKTSIGAHQLFLGQVREDQIANQLVTSIEFSAHEEMAESIIHQIREEAFANYDLTCLHIYHSLGFVQTGEICLFVFVSSAHRKASNEAIVFLVEQIKDRVPIFGREILSDDSHVWKENTKAQ